jgi:hypothetical protein
MKTVHALAPLASAVALGACDVAQSGQSGVLTFAFQELERSLPVDFDTPIAVGLRGTIVVKAGSSDAPLAVSDVTSSDPEVLEVSDVDANVFSLRARSPGAVMVTVETNAGSDSIDVRAAPLASVDLHGPGFLIPETPTPRAVVGGRMALPVSLRADSGGRLIGSGELPMAITADPAGASDAARDVSFGFIRPTFLAPGPVTLAPSAGAPIDLEVVTPSAIVDLELRGLDTRTSIEAGKSTTAVLRGLTADAAVVAGLEGVVTLTSDSRHCRIAPNLKAGDGVFEFVAVSAGTCTITASVAGQGGYSEAWSVSVTP